METHRTYTAFAATRCIASGDLHAMLRETKRFIDRKGPDSILIFEDQTGTQIDFDFRGSPDEVLERLSSHPHFAAAQDSAQPRSGPGRPKLGVVCREVSLLPRHWEWLEQQRGGISVALRKLIDEARKAGLSEENARIAREAASRFMWAMAGNLPDFEEASRALFAKDHDKLASLIAKWPKDIRNHVQKLVDEAGRLDKLADAPDGSAGRPPA